MNASELRRLMPALEIERLPNGLTVASVVQPGLPLVATALAYRAGTADETPGHGGTAHFLEHMMFKGSEHFGPGEIDLVTRALGGSNNAFTGHDMTLYYFTFAADRWQRALEIERDRMASLTLDPREVDAERQVILEEISMYESEPWDALEQRLMARAFPGHSYGRPVLGTREELEATGGDELRDFHHRAYRPANAVLVLSGGVGRDAVARVGEVFGDLDGGAPLERPREAAALPRELVRFERRAGELARLLLFLPAPPATDPGHPLSRLLAAVLGSGRSSRLHRALVDEGQLCVGVSVDVNETVDPGAFLVAAEVLPGVEPERVEEVLLAELAEIVARPPDQAELERARKIVCADWIFDHDKVHEQAFLAATALTLFDAEHPWRAFDRLFAAGTDELAEAAERTLVPERGAVLGWSLPESGAGA